MTDEKSSPDDEEGDDPQPGAAAGSAGSGAQPSGKRFREALPEELDPQSFMWSDDRSAVRVRMYGGAIDKVRGDADFIGAALTNLARVLKETAERFRDRTPVVGAPLLRNLEFGKSVVLELEISREENVQLSVDGSRNSPTIEAARRVSRLLAAAPDELMPLALELGEEPVAAYKRFLNVVGEDNVTVEWLPADARRVVVVTSETARQDFAILDREGAERTEAVRVPGTLTMADSELRQFALTLPSGLARPALLKGKHRVRGTYDEAMGLRLKRDALWDSEVMATIEVTYDAPGSTPTPRDPTYKLIDAEPLMSDSAHLFE